MSASDIWCQNPKCVQRKTNAQIRGSKGNKYYQSFKAQDYQSLTIDDEQAKELAISLGLAS